MAGQKVHSAKRKRFITNSVVHVVLGILAVIWVFPVIWVVLTVERCVSRGLMYPPSCRSPIHWITISGCLRIHRS